MARIASCRRSAQLVGRDAVPGQAGVDLDLDAGAGADPRAASDHLRQRPAARHGQVDPLAHARGDGRVTGRPQPGEDAALVAVGPQRQRLGRQGHAEPLDPGPSRGPGDRGHAVPVGVGLDDGHDGGVPGQPRDRGEVGADGTEVDDGGRAPHASSPNRAARIAAGTASAMSVAVTGAVTAASRPGAAVQPDRGSRRLGERGRIAAAVGPGGRPARRPRRPVSTSPEPAVPRSAVPSVSMKAAPSGSTMIVPGPLRTMVARSADGGGASGVEPAVRGEGARLEPLELALMRRQDGGQAPLGPIGDGRPDVGRAGDDGEGACVEDHRHARLEHGLHGRHVGVVADEARAARPARWRVPGLRAAARRRRRRGSGSRPRRRCRRPGRGSGPCPTFDERAAPVTSRAAPGYGRDPAQTPTTPRRYL